MARVSIIIPCYNLGAYVQEAIDSVLKQSYQDLEIIVVNDGSTDSATNEVLKNIHHPKVQVLFTQNQGLPAARNYGIEKSTGEFIACLDADDKYTFDFLEKTVVVLENDASGSVGFVTTWAKVFEGRDEIWQTHDYDPYLLAVKNVVHVASLFRKQCWREVGGYNCALTGYQDWDFWISIVARGYTWVCIKEPLFAYRIRPESMLSRSDGKRLDLYTQIVSHNFKFYQAHIKDILLQFFILSQQFDASYKEARLLYAQLSETHSILRVLSAELDETKQQLLEADKTKQQLQSVLDIQKEQLMSLQEQFHQMKLAYESIYNSFTWSFFNPILRFVDRCLPIQSRRRIWAVKIFQQIRHPFSLPLKIADFFLRSQRNVYLQSHDGPLVSVVIPCVNYGHYLEEAIDSVLNQTFQDFEIIVVEGGSTDGHTIEMVRALNKPKTQVFFRDKGLHLAGDNRNFGIEKARGKYICCLDADDLLEDTYLEKAVFVAETYSKDIVYPSVKCFGDSDRLWCTSDTDFLSCAEANAIPTVALFRKVVWEKIGGYKDWGKGEKHVPEDWEFWVRALGYGFSAKSIFEPLMRYRVHNAGLTATLKMPRASQVDIIRKSNASLFTLRNLRKLHRKLNVSLQVINPLVNLCKRVKTRPHVLLALPFIVKGGAEKVLLQISSMVVQELADITIITTVEPHSSMGTMKEAFYSSVSREIYDLWKFLPSAAEWKKFIFYILASRETDVLFIAGCSYIYDLLPEIKERYPNLKVIDILFNEVGHLSNNRKYSSYIDRTVAENKNVAQTLLLKHHAAESSVVLIQNGVDVNVFTPRERSVAVLSTFSVPNDVFVISFIGRFSREKGADIFVQIIYELAKRDSGFIFIMAGDGPEQDVIKHRIKKLGLEGHVRLPGFVDAKELLSITHVLLLPSRIDGRPNIVLEAMAMEVPVVASNVGGIPSIIDNGKDGFVCDADDIEDFVKKVLLLKRDPILYQAMSHLARQAMIDSFQVSDMLEKHRQLFSGLLAPLSVK